MPVSAGVVYVDIAPQVAKSFGSDIEKQVTGPVEESGKRVGGSLTKVAGLIGSAFAAKGIFDFGKAAIEAATESNKIAAQTEAVIKSTGGAAKVTAAQIGDLATAISNKTGVDDEAIQSASNLLLTFTNLKNGVGKSNDVFNQATKIAVDMGAALGGDASSNAIQLGKALNDPVKGIAALSRVGVTFTDQQKEQIKTMVATGNTMGAQKVILAELNKEFGGSAEAQATAGDKLKVVWGNLQEQIGNQLLPIFNKVATFAAENLPQAFEKLSGAVGRIGAVVGPIIKTLQLGVGAFFAALKEGDVTSDGFVGTMERIGDFIHQVVNAFREFGLTGGDFAETIDRLIGGGGRFTPVIQAIFVAIENVTNFVKDHFVPILIGLGVTIALLTAPVTTVIAAIVLAYVRFETFRDIVNTVIDFLVNVAAPAVTKFAQAVIEQIQHLIDWVQQYWPQFSEAIIHVFNVIVDVVTALWRQWGDDLGRIISTVWDYIKGTIDNVLQVIRGIIQTVLALINGDWGKAWDGIKGILAGIWDQITNTIRTAIDAVKSLLGGLASTAGEIFASMVEAIVKAILSIPGKIANVGKDILSKLIPDIPGGGIIKDVLGKIPGLASGGIVTRPTLAMIGEREAEAVIPLSEMRGPGGPGGATIHQTFNKVDMDPFGVAAELGWLLRTSGR